MKRRGTPRVSGILRRKGKNAWIDPDDPRVRVIDNLVGGRETNLAHHARLIVPASGTDDRVTADRVMVDMATACNGLLSSAPDIDLWDGASAHDLA